MIGRRRRDAGARPAGSGRTRSAGVDPAREQGVGVDVGLAEVGDVVVGQKPLQAALLPGGEGVGGAAEVGAGDEDLGDGRDADAAAEGDADLAAEIAFLVGGGVEVDRAVGDAGAGEEVADRPAELAPFEREKDDRGAAGRPAPPRRRRRRGRWARGRGAGAGAAAGRRCGSRGWRRPAPAPPRSWSRGCPGRAAWRGSARRCRGP